MLPAVSFLMTSNITEDTPPEPSFTKFENSPAAAHQPLTAPAVMPDTIHRSATKTNRTTGTTIKVP